MKGKIALGVLALAGILFLSRVRWHDDNPTYYAIIPEGTTSREPVDDVTDKHDSFAVKNDRLVFYRNGQVILDAGFTGDFNIFGMNTDRLYDVVKRKKALAGGGDDYVYHFGDDDLGFSQMFGAPSFVHRARAYASDFMFRAMGGPRGSMDTSPNPALAALPAPGDD